MASNTKLPKSSTAALQVSRSLARRSSSILFPSGRLAIFKSPIFRYSVCCLVDRCDLYLSSHSIWDPNISRGFRTSWSWARRYLLQILPPRDACGMGEEYLLIRNSVLFFLHIRYLHARKCRGDIVVPSFYICPAVSFFRMMQRFRSFAYGPYRLILSPKIHSVQDKPFPLLSLTGTEAFGCSAATISWGRLGGWSPWIQDSLHS